MGLFSPHDRARARRWPVVTGHATTMMMSDVNE